jgi:hypothetical protein
MRSDTTFAIDTNDMVIANLENVESKPYLVTNTDTDYIILNCDPTLVFRDDTIRGRMNAVVLCNQTRDILAIGPSKPYTMDKFKQIHGDVIPRENRQSIEITEMVEGLFFQLFWDERINKWEIGTHNAVSGNYAYYRMPHLKSPTYREMICQAMGDIEDLNDWKGLPFMDKKCCFHFVLQHPANHFVYKIPKPVLYMIGAFELHANGVKNQIRPVPPSEYENIFPPDLVLLPIVLRMERDSDEDITYEEVLEEFVSIQQPFTRMGIVIQQLDTGDTTIAITPAYEELHKIRGTHPNILFHYLCLKRIKKTEEFVRLFPQYHEFFCNFHEIYESTISKIHQSYVDHFVLKTKQKIHKKYFFHIMQLHNTVFIPSLREGSKVIVKKQVVRKYVEGLEPGHILHLLQYEIYTSQGVIRPDTC